MRSSNAACSENLPLREWRLRIGRRAKDVAAQLLISRTHMSLVERGLTRPGLELSARIQEVTGIPMTTWVKERLMNEVTAFLKLYGAELECPLADIGSLSLSEEDRRRVLASYHLLLSVLGSLSDLAAWVCSAPGLASVKVFAESHEAARVLASSFLNAPDTAISATLLTAASRAALVDEVQLKAERIQE